MPFFQRFSHTRISVGACASCEVRCECTESVNERMQSQELMPSVDRRTMDQNRKYRGALKSTEEPTNAVVNRLTARIFVAHWLGKEDAPGAGAAAAERGRSRASVRVDRRGHGRPAAFASATVGASFTLNVVHSVAVRRRADLTIVVAGFVVCIYFCFCCLWCWFLFL